MIQASWFTTLMTGVGGAELLGASAGAAMGAAVALAAITMGADQELALAIRGAAMEFEQDTLEKVISARARAVSAPTTATKGEAENILTQALGKLFAVMENYPVLKSNQNVMQLQEELTSTENKISFARQLYNDLVANYRTKIQVFPNNFISSLFNFKSEEYFGAEVVDRAVPTVDVSLRGK